MDLDLVLRVGFIVGYVAGIFAGGSLLISNAYANNRGKMIGFLIGLALVIPFLQGLSKEGEIPFLKEGAYLLGGVYLIVFKQLIDKSRPIIVRNFLGFVGCLILLVPFKFFVDLII